VKRPVDLNTVPEEALLSIPETARLMRLDIRIVRELVGSGELRSLPIGTGRELRIPRFCIREWQKRKVAENSMSIDETFA
jgi:hypothetical protein